MRVIPLTAALLAAASVVAAPTPATIPALAPTGAPSLLGVLQVCFALFVVLAAIFACAWLLRRLGAAQFGGNAQLRVVAGTAVGPKERVVIVEVRDTWLVLGVTAAEVSTLHTMPKPDDAPSNATAPGGGFAERLASVLAKRRQPVTES